jgi:hypothetical protein
MADEQDRSRTARDFVPAFLALVGTLIAAFLGGVITLVAQAQSTTSTAHQTLIDRRAGAYGDFAVAQHRLQFDVLLDGLGSALRGGIPPSTSLDAPAVPSAKEASATLTADLTRVEDATARVTVLGSDKVSGLASGLVGKALDAETAVSAWAAKPGDNAALKKSVDTIAALSRAGIDLDLASQAELSAGATTGVHWTVGWLRLVSVVWSVLLALSVIGTVWSVRRLLLNLRERKQSGDQT